LVRIQGERILNGIKVRDMQGRLVFSQQANELSLDLNLSHLQQGVYSIEVGDDTGNYYQRLVLQ